MFNDYLHNPDCYFRLERSFYEFFRLEAQTNKIDIKGFKAPYYNTTFSNGTPFMDGRGDNMPPDLLHCISSQDIDDFRVIVDCAVEVGLVDMYSTPTERPIKFIEMIFLILSRNNIALPRL